MQTLSFEHLDEDKKIGLLKFNRPKAMNALNAQLLSEMATFLEEHTGELNVLIFTGTGDKAFVAGADIKEMQQHSPAQAYEMSKLGQAVFSKIENMNCATIAAVNGFALGGGMELSLSCDMIFASSKAKFGLPEVSLGLIPGYGGTQRLSRAIGLQKAKHMVFTGDMFTAQQVKGWGLLCDVFEPDELMDAVALTAKSISKKSSVAIHIAKKAMHKGYPKKMKKALDIEAEAFKDVFETQDHDEGILAFIEKRKPEFVGK